MHAMRREPTTNREDTQVENLCYEKRQPRARSTREHHVWPVLGPRSHLGEPLYGLFLAERS